MRFGQQTIAAALLSLAGAAHAQVWVVGPSSTMNLGSNRLELGCADVTVAGTVDLNAGALSGARHVSAPASGRLLGGGGTLTFSGDLDTASALDPQTSTIRSEDGCGSAQSRVVGAHSFYHLVVHSNLGRSLILPSGLMQQVSDRIELVGGAQHLVIRSSMANQAALIRLDGSGTWATYRIDAQDVGTASDSAFIAPDPPAAYDSIDRGNTPRFLGPDVATPIPAVSLLSMLAMALGLLASTRLHQHRSGAT